MLSKEEEREFNIESQTAMSFSKDMGYEATFTKHLIKEHNDTEEY